MVVEAVAVDVTVAVCRWFVVARGRLAVAVGRGRRQPEGDGRSWLLDGVPAR